jgi:hypothetical protein
MFTRRRSLRSLAALVLALPLFAIGCSDDDNSPTAPETGDAYVRVAHLSPDAPAVDVWVDGNVVLQDVAFDDFSSYLPLPAGRHRVQVSPANQTTPIVIDANVDIAEGKSYTVAAMGPLASISAVVLTDDVARDPSAAKIRFVHASPDAPPVDITLTDGTVLFEEVAFKGSEGSRSVAAGTYDLQVRVAGSETVALSFADVPVSNGTNYSIFATGKLSDGSLKATVSVDAPGNGSTTVKLAPATANLRVAHLSPDAPSVDIYVDGSPVVGLQGVSYRAVSGYLSIPAATHNVKVYVAGTTTAPVIDANLTLNPGASYTVAATGLVGQGDLSPVVLMDDRAGTTAGKTLVRFVHLSPDAPNVDVKVQDGPTIFNNVGFRGAEGYDEVGSGSYDLEVRLTVGGALALAVPGVDLMAGQSYTVFAAGLAGSGTLEAILVKDTP